MDLSKSSEIIIEMFELALEVPLDTFETLLLSKRSATKSEYRSSGLPGAPSSPCSPW